jgi:hypothetical protein
MTDPMLHFFSFAHLPANLPDHVQVTSKLFDDMARHIVETLPAGHNRTVGLRKLLESKKCIVRSGLVGADQSEQPETWR